MAWDKFSENNGNIIKILHYLNIPDSGPYNKYENFSLLRLPGSIRFAAVNYLQGEHFHSNQNQSVL